MGEITDLEFENHLNLKKCIFRALEQAGTNICSIGKYILNFKIGLSLFGCAEKYTEQSTHCARNVLAQLQLFFSHLCDNLADSLRSFGPALQYDQLKLIYIFQISNLLKFLKAGLNLLNLDRILSFMASISMSSEVNYLQDSPPHCKYWIQLRHGICPKIYTTGFSG